MTKAIFITTYQKYRSWHPAEGGIWLTSMEMNSSEKVEGEVNAKLALEKAFNIACKQYGIDPTTIDRTPNVDNNGYHKNAHNDYVSIFLYINNEEPVVSGIQEDNWGETYEHYESWLDIDEKDEDGNCYSVIPESEKGFHTRYPVYC